ncbi:MAG: T9SS type A sorting domain-containing protein [Bacteroidota bacterium]|nr:T9SS type A sorting domain-containing protein [Bacteroidota bacterium]
MKTLFIRLLLSACTLITSIGGWAQSTFSTHILADPFTRATSLCMVDLDGDGDQDIVAGSGGQGVCWYENIGEKPTRFTSHTIDPGLKKVFTVVCGDLDQDGLVDVAAGSWDDNDVVWYRNTGDGGWDKTYVDQNLVNVHELFICDLNQDQKPDLLAAGAGENKVVWYRNEMGEASQWSKQFVDQEFGGARSVAAADLDGDGDLDIVGGASDVNEVSIWMNLGGDPAEWEKTVITNTFTGSHRVQIADINHDGLPDVLGAAWGVNEVSWWENNGDQADQWPKHVLNNALSLSMTALASDLDSDGDLDVIGAGLNGEVSWYENTDGHGVQWRTRIIDQDLAGAWPVCVGDVDGDKDLDIVVGGDQGNQIRWYENKQVGRFTNNINIDGVSTNLGFFVPEEYDPNQAYKLIVGLHICGDENEYSRYRDNLIALCLELDAILVAPDCHNTINNIDVPDPAYILEAIEYATKRFNIDEEYVYLTGGSCNGRTTLKYGLEKIFDFRGVIPFNAYIPNWTDGDYDFTSDMPVCFASGTADANYANCQEAYNQLMQNQGKAKFVSMQGVGHDFYFPEFTNVMLQCINYIDSIAGSTTSTHQLGFAPHEINVYPNPFNDNLTIQLPEVFEGEVNISISNMIGQIIYEKDCNTISNSGKTIQLNLSELTIFNSVLILQIENQNNIFRKRIVKN